MKKALVILLTLAMILGMTAVPVVAAEEETETFIPAKEINDFGQVPADYKPEGTAITNAEEFAAMDPAGTYYLANDITISETYPTPFSGTFDGNGKAITTSVPLFNVVDGTVKNLTTKGKLVVTEKPTTGQAMAHAGVIAVAASEGGDSYFTNICNMANMESAVVGFGGIVGMVNQDNDGTVAYFTKCVNYGNIASAVTGNDDSGGICGEIDANQENPKLCGVFKDCANYGIINAGGRPGGILGTPNATVTMKNCYNAGDIQSTSNYCGGIVGRLGQDDNDNKDEAGVKYECLIEDCVNDGDVIVFKSQGGGIVGYLDGDGVNDFVFKNCVNNGDIYGADPSVTYKLGGIVGGGANTVKSETFEKCVNNGTIGSENWGAALNVGGIAGSADGTTIVFNECINNGDVIGNNRAGGLAGGAPNGGPKVTPSTLTVTKCGNTADITGAQVGGLFGYVYAGATSVPTIKYSFSTGKISGTTYVAGLIAYMNACTADIAYNYVAGEIENTGVATAVSAGDDIKQGVLYTHNGKYFYSSTTGEFVVEGDTFKVDPILSKTYDANDKLTGMEDFRVHEVKVGDKTLNTKYKNESTNKDANFTARYKLVVDVDGDGVNEYYYFGTNASEKVVTFVDGKVLVDGAENVPAMKYDGDPFVLKTFDKVGTWALFWNNNSTIKDFDATKNYVEAGYGDFDYVQGLGGVYGCNTFKADATRYTEEEFKNGTAAYKMNEVIKADEGIEDLFRQNLLATVFVVDEYPTTDANHAKVVTQGSSYSNDLFEKNADITPPTGDVTVYFVVALAVATVSLAALAVVKKRKEN